ncbi:MAG: 50S ribosomal protein L29 [Nitrospirae bacterium GWC2_57_13]|jgi:large subunit ribosomal protein L29|nr:MAG: 50S ribosomal protein L29 [Nitrospirae bacterium GWC1_57_7]OGW28831.1 MAG: 50S ribosomal protein L29 [Nitrospirae bacterium GWC2_57_13]OGW44617.1 MAG: 50S ribosomal protein L29 [Nitrospirae bacterium GWD2_57_8]
MKARSGELRDLSADELAAKTADLKKELFNLRFQQAMGQIENPMRLRVLRREIARTKTILKEKHGRA